MADFLPAGPTADAVLRTLRLGVGERQRHYDQILDVLSREYDRELACEALEAAVPLGAEESLDRGGCNAVTTRARTILAAFGSGAPLLLQ